MTVATMTPFMIPGDARATPLADSSAQCVVTSPPYLMQRSYGDDPLEIGQTGTVAEFCDQMVEVAKEMRRILKPDGIYWLNLADKANGSGGAGGDYNKGGSKEGKPRFGRFNDPNFLVTQFLDVPGKVVAGLQADNWRLRSYIVWSKGVESRESLVHVNRPRVSHEVLLMLAPGPGRSKFFPEGLVETGSVWSFPTASREKKGHAAPFPDELPRRCILASTDVGDLVVDPFVGSGTTARVAVELGRRGVGIDLYAAV